MLLSKIFRIQTILKNTSTIITTSNNTVAWLLWDARIRDSFATLTSNETIKVNIVVGTRILYWSLGAVIYLEGEIRDLS